MKKEERLHLYREMLRIRRFEEMVKDLFASMEILGSVHLYIGEEAVAVGACAALRPDDYLTSTHRGHGHVLAKGAEPGRMFAELLGRIDILFFNLYLKRSIYFSLDLFLFFN